MGRSIWSRLSEQKPSFRWSVRIFIRITSLFILISCPELQSIVIQKDIFRIHEKRQELDGLILWKPWWVIRFVWFISLCVNNKVSRFWFDKRNFTDRLRNSLLFYSLNLKMKIFIWFLLNKWGNIYLLSQFSWTDFFFWQYISLIFTLGYFIKRSGFDINVISCY